MKQINEEEPSLLFLRLREKNIIYRNYIFNNNVIRTNIYYHDYELTVKQN